MEHTVTSQNFNEIVENSNKTVILDFWATWCGPCKMIAPIIEEIANERDDIIVGKVNVDEEAELCIKFGIVSIPTIIVFKNGEIYNKTVGYCSKEEILELTE